MDEGNGTPPRPSATSSDSMRVRIQNLRNNILNDPRRHTAAQQQVALRALDSEEQDRLDDLTRNRLDSAFDQITTDADSLFDSQPSAGTINVVRMQRQAWRARERRQRRDRERTRMQRLARDDTTFQPSPVPSPTVPVPSSRPRRPSASHDRQDLGPQARDGRASKRRKLGDGTVDDTPIFSQYGLEGTLLPGNLIMHVLDIPGEPELDHAEASVRHKLHQACNREIFRTLRPSLSILMKHRNGWPFSLSKMIIKIPAPYCTAVSGMIFISMEDDLAEETSCYDTLTPVERRWADHHLHHQHHQHPMHDTYHPPYAWGHPASARQALVLPIGKREDQSPEDLEPLWFDPCLDRKEPICVATQPMITAEVELLALDTNDAYDPHYVLPTWHDARVEYRRYNHRHSRPSAYTMTAQDPDAGQQSQEEEAAHDSISDDISTSSDVEDDDEEDPAPNLYRIGRYSDIPEYPPNQAASRSQTFRETLQERRDRGEGTYTPIPSHTQGERYDHNLSEAGGSSQAAWTNPLSTKRLPGCNDLIAGKEADADADADAGRILPHATFKIESVPGTAGVTIKLDPEVSGKYILVKLWSHCNTGGIAVSNIIPYGFSGMRQMPDSSLR